MKIKELVCFAARLADEKKAEDIRVIDLCGLSSLCDYILLATANSKPHLDAVEEEISKKLKEKGYYKLNRDGKESPLWRVSDYGGFLVHIMTQEARSFYALEELFSFGKPVDFKKPAPKKAVRKPAAKKPAAKKTVRKTAAKKAAASKKAVKKTTKKTATKKAIKTTLTKRTVRKTAAK